MNRKRQNEQILKLPPKKKFKSTSESASSGSSDGEQLFSPLPHLYAPTAPDTPYVPSLSASSSLSSLTSASSSTDNASTISATSSSSGYSSAAQKMMAMMGYKEGKGLGKHSEGRVDIVESSKQRGRRGLGLKTKGFEPSAEVTWDGKEEVSAHETIEWLPPSSGVPTEDEIEEWRFWTAMGVKLTIDDETEFCDEELLSTLLNQKSAFDLLDGEEMRQARTRSNPYETIRGGIFLNRAAMKMANMDYVCDRMFTAPKDANGKPVVGDNELLYFADICAGPGGFSEYVLWQKKFRVKGYGFTLKGGNDFKLEDFYAASSEFFEPHYGVNGMDGDGDIMRSDNQTEFRRFVSEQTHGQGVHFVMADGGFSVEGQENIQEILTKQLLLCQFLVALSILREGGHFVCKTFDLFTPFSVGLVYVLYRAFDHVSIFKPVTSRPANSERYVICKGLRSNADCCHDLLFELNQKLIELKRTKQDILESVPMKQIREDKVFMDYVIAQNERQARTQTQALAKIQAFVRNTDLIEAEQNRMREECLKLWKVPNRTRSAPKLGDPMTKFRDLVKDSNSEYFHRNAMTLDKDKLPQKLKSVFDYRCCVSAGDRYFILGVGRSHVFCWDGKSMTRWRKLDRCSLQLPGDTLLEAELIEELRGEGSGQRRILALHIIDAMWLGGEDIRAKHYTERITKIGLFVKAVDRPTRYDLTPVRVKEVFRCEEMIQIFDRLEMKLVKGSGRVRRLCYRTNTNRHFIPTGVYFIKTINDPWSTQWSKTNKMKYFFNYEKRLSTYECPADSIASFKACRISRLQWVWEEGVKVHDEQEFYENPNKISRQFILNHINSQRPVL